MLSKTYGAAIQGIEASTITIEVNATRGIKYFLVGLPDVAVRESHERIFSSFMECGLKIPSKQIIINMAPADIRKEGAAFDLPLAIGILAATGECNMNRDYLESYMMMGELGLDGSLQPIRGAISIALRAKKDGFEGVILPMANAREAAVVSGIDVYGANNLLDVVNFFKNNLEGLERVTFNPEQEFADERTDRTYDFCDVKGQENVKRAMEVAAAGGHNILLVGSPGCGKSMIAKCLPSILPQLTLEESLETTQIYSAAGKMNIGSSLVTQRPFRSPHHSVSSAALVGGGNNFQPGEISLAHNGVLFLDELPEFSKSVLETLRQPLEDRRITISRVKYSFNLPCSFMLVASMNPCPCGYYANPYHQCRCTPGQIQQYTSKISGPLMDRIDIQVFVDSLPIEKLTSNKVEEKSEVIRARVESARGVQIHRFINDDGIYCNAQMDSRLLHKYTQLDDAGRSLLKSAMSRLNLSARAYDRILRVARTIADLDNSENIQSRHLAEAIGYRALDRSSWGE